MELLSILSIANSIIPFDKLLAYIDIHEELPVVTYVMTPHVDNFTLWLNRWEQSTNVILMASTKVGGISNE